MHIEVKVRKDMSLDKTAGRSSNKVDREVGESVSCLDIVLAG